jgi:osmotically-inducible protein OsmY
MANRYDRDRTSSRYGEEERWGGGPEHRYSRSGRGGGAQGESYDYGSEAERGRHGRYDSEYESGEWSGRSQETRGFWDDERSGQGPRRGGAWGGYRDAGNLGYGRSGQGYGAGGFGTGYGLRMGAQSGYGHYEPGTREGASEDAMRGYDRGVGGRQEGLSRLDRWAQVGPYTGRGPKGYERSDERIREDICDRFTQHGYLDASDIEIRVERGEITLFGTVDSREAKHLAEDIAEEVSGVKNVQNQLRVSHGQERESSQHGGLQQSAGGQETTADNT